MIETNKNNGRILKFEKKDTKVVPFERPADGASADDENLHAVPECKDGVCILAWKPRRPTAAA